ncbi:glycosyltransferase [Erythrobacter ani]|uniref:Glycosyltransferase n=1 Tax=Erythrobacter ani TaxID=2827235 RepID=A0ABS6SPJ2_9SPHN|nr:glycosyltransferase [Erythrobacter ani]MBV7266951.1 glycosyltransferase [Erythrobacter ani]
MAGFKIAYVINSMEGGGAQTPLPRIVQALNAAGAETTVLALTRRNGKALPALTAAGLETVIRERGDKDHLAALRWIDRQARALGAHALFTSLTRATLLGQIVANRMNMPIASWQHNAFLKPWNERLLRWRAGKSDLWVSDSNEVAKLTRDRLAVPADQCLTWPIFAADPDAARAIPWRAGETLRLGSLGRLHPAKGYDLLIEALLLLQRDGWQPPVPIEISIAGTGGDEAELRLAASEVHIADIHFAGFINDPGEFLAGLHLYLQPSRREGFCIAAHEAMQAGLPVIVSDTGEMAITTEPEFGSVVRTGEIDDLARALREMLRDPSSLHSAGAVARETVLRKFSGEAFDSNAQKVVDHLKAALRTRSPN